MVYKILKSSSDYHVRRYEEFMKAVKNGYISYTIAADICFSYAFDDTPLRLILEACMDAEIPVDEDTKNIANALGSDAIILFVKSPDSGAIGVLGWAEDAMEALEMLTEIINQFEPVVVKSPELKYKDNTFDIKPMNIWKTL